MVIRLLACLSLILAAAGCGQVNVNIDSKFEDALPSVATSAPKVEATVGSTLNKTTSSGYKVTSSVGDAPKEAYQKTTGGYKVMVGVTGAIMYNY